MKRIPVERIQAIFDEIQRRRWANHEYQKGTVWRSSQVSIVEQKALIDWIVSELQRLIQPPGKV